MGEPFGTYPYLFGCLVLLALAAVAWWLLPSQRRPLLLSGILATPFGLAAVQLVPEYYQPVRVAVFFVGPEDLLFSFAAGVLAWALAVFPVRHRLVLRLHIPSLLLPFARCLLFGIALHVACRLSGLRGLESYIVPGVSLGAVLLAIRPSLWPISLTGAVFFPLVYLAVPVAMIRMQPQFLSEWNLANLSGALLFGVPIEEAWWAFGYGAAWPLIVASVLDARVSSPARSAAAIAREETEAARTEAAR